MTALLIRGTELTGLPVVTMGGDDVAEIRDVVYHPDEGRLVGFTLNKRGRLAGPRKESLSFGAVSAIGRDAVMIEDDTALGGSEVAAVVKASRGRNVLGNDVLTDGGRRLGEVTDLVVDATTGTVVGYELRGDEHLQAHAGQPLLVPIPDTLAVSGNVLMVPAATEPYIRDDLSGFGAAVEEFRAMLEGGSDAAVGSP